MKIVSLLPSATEIVVALGLGDHLVAVTHECDFPPQIRTLPKITSSLFDHRRSSGQEIHRHISDAVHTGAGLYALDQSLLERLNPDLLLTQELCEVCAVSYTEVSRAVRLLEGERRVVSLEPESLGGILDTILQVARETGVQARGAELVEALRKRVQAVTDRAAGASTRPRVLAMEWLDPPFAGGHWIPEMIRLAGGRDGLGEEGVPSREVSWERIAHFDPEVVVAMPCGLDLRQTVRELRRTDLPECWRHLAAVRQGKVYAVDGSSFFNRPGPRIVDGLEILEEILHPERRPRRHSTRTWTPVALD